MVAAELSPILTDVAFGVKEKIATLLLWLMADGFMESEDLCNHPYSHSVECESILEQRLAGERLSSDQALKLLRAGDFLRLQAAARTLRHQTLPMDQASYTRFLIINYTNYCEISCAFCSFMSEVESGKGYTLTLEDVSARLRPYFDEGVTQLFLQGGVHPELPLDYYLELLSGLKAEFGPTLHIRGFSPVEIRQMQRIAGEPLDQLLERLREAGLDSVPGAGAEILSERVRHILSSKKCSVEEWVSILEACHQSGLPGSANVVFGSEESDEELIEHLRIVRDLQDRSGGFYSFVPWTFQQQTKRFRVRNVAAHEYLKVLALCRLFFDNIDHIETSVMVLGTGVGGLALHSGADDISSVVFEENVLRNFGVRSVAQAEEFLQSAGFTPRCRDFAYNYQ